jgi:hypothetical protein
MDSAAYRCTEFACMESTLSDIKWGKKRNCRKQWVSSWMVKYCRIALRIVSSLLRPFPPYVMRVKHWTRHSCLFWVSFSRCSWRILFNWYSERLLQRGVPPADCWNWTKLGTNERGPSLAGSLGLSCWYKRFLSFLMAAVVSHSTKYFFPRRPLFQFICPHHPASCMGR